MKLFGFRRELLREVAALRADVAALRVTENGAIQVDLKKVQALLEREAARKSRRK